MENRVQIFSKNYYSDHTTSEVISKLDALLNEIDSDATISYGYPIKGDINSQLQNMDILIVGPKVGVILVGCSDATNDRAERINSLIDRTYAYESVLYGNFVKRGTNLQHRHALVFNLYSILFIPSMNSEKVGEQDNGVEIVNTSEGLIASVREKTEQSTNLSEKQYESIKSVIDYAGGMIKPPLRKLSEEDDSSKGYLLNKVEAEISNFDVGQRKAAMTEILGPQRIRGLAGSGKTIILCMKVAVLHAKYPEKKILYTFMTRSLYGFIEQLITRFYRLISDDGTAPNFDNIDIMHAWGGRSYPGVYYNACIENDASPLSYADAIRLNRDPFEYVCADLLRQTKGNLREVYDYVFIDEAQDFKPEFYQICRALTRNDNVIWAYDNLQNIYDVKIQDPIATFENKYGAAGLNLVENRKKYPQIENDIVLYKSYRNARQILLAAQALGFGIYAPTLIQTIDDNQQWRDLGYTIVKGESKIGDEMIIKRPEENSPLVLSNDQTFDQLIKIHGYSNMNEEIDAVAKAILQDINNESLRPEDITVISMDDRYAKIYFSKLEQALLSYNIGVFNLLSNSYIKGFHKENYVTLSTVYKAKGNESGMVYIVGTDSFEQNSNSIKFRNRLFVAMTRTTGWLSISGVGELETIQNELNELKKNNLEFKFVQQDVKVVQQAGASHLARQDAADSARDSIEKAIELGVSPEVIQQFADKARDASHLENGR